MMDMIDGNIERIYIPNENFTLNNMKYYEEEFDKFVMEDTRDMVINFKFVPKIDSMFIVTLLKLKRKLEKRNRKFKLVNPNESVRLILDTIGLETFSWNEPSNYANRWSMNFPIY